MLLSLLVPQPTLLLMFIIPLQPPLLMLLYLLAHTGALTLM